MAAPKGHKRYGGRAKGTPNADSLPLEAKAKELKVDPFEVLLLFAAGDWKALGYETEQAPSSYSEHGTVYKYTIDPSVRTKAAAEACSYLHAKRKALEVSSEVDPALIDAFKAMQGVSEDELRKIVADELRKSK
jgi:hypothetical protein